MQKSITAFRYVAEILSYRFIGLLLDNGNGLAIRVDRVSRVRPGKIGGLAACFASGFRCRMLMVPHGSTPGGSPSMLLFMPKDAGDLIGGRYLLAEPTGQGGLGRIWRGHDQLLDREVAVTEISLQPRPGEDRAGMVDDIMRKVRAAAQLGAPGGIMIHDVAEHADALWIVTQPGDGESLDAEITRTGRLPWQREARTEVAAAAAAAPALAASGTATPGHDAVPQASAPVPRTAPSAPGPGDRGTGRLAAAMRTNTGLTVGAATGIVMILALILVVMLFPSHHRPTSSPGGPAVSPASSASPP
jgi:hypothetical protein